MTKSEISRNPCKLKAYFSSEKMQYSVLKHKDLFESKILNTRTKNKTLFWVIYTENKPGAGYA